MRPEERIAPLIKRIDALEVEGTKIVAIDGMSASGKSTMAQLLAAHYGCSVVRMDDFFLLPSLRTPERLGEPGGNLHRERFMEEVLPRLRGGKDFSYRVFSCRVMDYNGENLIHPSGLIIVEGAYSQHPAFGRYADLRVFSEITPEEQRERIVTERGERAEGFFTKWIPMENKYFEAFDIKSNADMII